MPTSTTPNIMTAVKLWMALPPNSSSASNASVTVTWVMIERDSVELMDSFEQFRHRHFLVTPQHFPDPVIDHDGVVQRIAENRQQRRDAGQVEIDLRDRHEADGQHDVMDVGDHGAERELPFEPEPEIDQDRKDREHQAEHAVGQQFAGYARSDHFDAAIIDGIAERAANLLHRRLLRGIAAGLFGNPDQHLGRPAELLQLDVAEAKAAQRRTHRGDIGGAGLGLHFQQRSALEIDAEIQPVGKEQRDRDDRKQPPKSEN